MIGNRRSKTLKRRLPLHTVFGTDILLLITLNRQIT